MFDLPEIGFNASDLKRQLIELRRDVSLTYEYNGVGWFAPRSINELTALRQAHPDATILAGCTDVGLWVNKQFRDLGNIISVTEVGELKGIRTEQQLIRIGAGVSLTDAYQAVIQHYPEVSEMCERFASVPIRNAGTLGGNVANGSPIGDSMPWLIALGASVILRNSQRSRTLLLQDFYIDYMHNALQADEVLEAVLVPLPVPDLHFRTYKLAKRYDSDISAVCAAFAIHLKADRIIHASLAFGGMAATPRRSPLCEQAMMGESWNDVTARAAQAALPGDFKPLSDMRASSDYRMRSAQNLLYRFYLETRPKDPLPASSLNVFAFC